MRMHGLGSRRTDGTHSGRFAAYVHPVPPDRVGPARAPSMAVTSQFLMEPGADAIDVEQIIRNPNWCADARRTDPGR